MSNKNTYLDIDSTTLEYVRTSAPTTSAGATDAYTMFATGADGKFDASLIPSTEASFESIIATEAIPNNSVVTLYAVAGARRIQLASASDRTKAPMAFVEVGVNTGETAQVQIGGIIKTAITGFTTADIRVPVYLSTTTIGGITKTAPTAATGVCVWNLGRVVEVGTVLRVDFRPFLVVRYT